MVAGDLWGMPVRAMEAVLDHEEEAVEPVARVLRRAVRVRPELWGELTPEADDELLMDALWPAVLLGELGRPGGASALADAVRDTDADDHVLREAAAEGLAKIGAPALDEVGALVQEGEPADRLWAYAALGWMGGDDARGMLLDALEADPEMLDVVGPALAAHGRQEDVSALHEALVRAEPWMRPDLEDATRDLARGRTPENPLEEDWRLRYRIRPGLGRMSLTWAAVAAMVREEETVREGRAGTLARPLEEILARPEEEREPERCECCGVVPFRGTGVEVCPEIAVSVALVQHRMLGEAREEGYDDLFELMDDVEAESQDLEEAAEDGAAWARRDRTAGERTRIALLHGACRWLVERGVESVGPGRATLLAEAVRLADLHGDPRGHLSGGGALPTEGPARAPETPGRNDPCPCGSGAKYKRCCGAPA